MTAPAAVIGRWRIIEADLWDRGYTELGGPATIASDPITTARSPLAPCKPASI